MAYNASYDDDDISPIAIDGLATFGVVFVQLITVIALVVMAVWVKKRMK